jgi:hypothetical protein
LIVLQEYIENSLSDTFAGLESVPKAYVHGDVWCVVCHKRGPKAKVTKVLLIEQGKKPGASFKIRRPSFNQSQEVLEKLFG